MLAFEIAQGMAFLEKKCGVIDAEDPAVAPAAHIVWALRWQLLQ